MESDGTTLEAARMGFPINPKNRMGLVPLLAGLALAAIAAFDPRDSAFSSGRLPVAAAGAVFFFAGLAVVIDGLETRYRGALLALNGTIVLLSFACVPLLIAWKSGVSFPLLIAVLVLLSLAGMALRATIRSFRRVPPTEGK
jgi:drug/metabolite transporter (DMT)-like permease